MIKADWSKLAKLLHINVKKTYKMIWHETI